MRTPPVAALTDCMEEISTTSPPAPSGPGDDAPSSSSPGFSSAADGAGEAGVSGDPRSRGAKNAPLSIDDVIRTRVKGEKVPKTGLLDGGVKPQGGRKRGSPHRPHPSPKIKKIRGEIALAQHLAGKDMKQIAADFNVSAPTIRAEVNNAIRGQIFTEAKDFIQGTLVPKALRVIDEALNTGNTETARWLLDKTALHADAVPWNGGGGGDKNESFESWRLELVRKVGTTREAQNLPAGPSREGAERAATSPGLVIDAQVVPPRDESKARE